MLKEMFLRAAGSVKKQAVYPFVMPWLIAFVLLNIVVTQDGDKNAMSRFATMRAISESGTFQITKYQEWTIDWARTPDGNYYSNKAPGPMLLAFPLFWAIDQVTRLGEKGYRDEHGRRKAPGYIHKLLVPLFFQVLPFCVLAFMCATFLHRKGASQESIHFAMLALLFANTSAIFMNNWFGHGFAACLVLATAFALQRKSYHWLGFFLGCAILSDYSAALLLPFVFLALLYQARNNLKHSLQAFIFGGIIPGTLFVWYHWSSFGTPFTLPNKYQNPDFVTAANVEGNIWGIFSPSPNLTVLNKLLWGPERGLLYTQPWLLMVLAILIFLLFKKAKLTEAFHFIYLAIAGFFALLWMNVSFTEWHGGMTAGPRYLCMIFPLFAVVAGFIFGRVNRPIQYLLWLTLLIAIQFRAQIYATTILTPIEPLWNWQWREFTKSSSGTPYLRFAIFWIVLALAYWRIRVKSVKQS